MIRVVLILVCLGIAQAASAQLFNKGAQQPEVAVQSAEPAENLLLITADVQRHINDDIYRFPYPQDSTGQNVFRAAIVRLSNYEKLFPGQNADAVAIAKAQCFERLCAFREAALNYESGKKSTDSALKDLASKGFDRCKKFSEIADRTDDMRALVSFEDGIKQKIADLKKLTDEYVKTPFQCLAQVERERAQMKLAEFYSMFRFMHPYSTDMALKQVKDNLKDNPDSKRRYAHHLMLGTLYYELAREYTILHDPEGPDFSLQQFEGYAKSARAELSIVEQADGFDEKQEGRALLTAVGEFSDRIRDRAR